MAINTEKTPVQERFEKLPVELRDKVLSATFQRDIESLVFKQGLDRSHLIDVSNEIILVILGLEDIEDLDENLHNNVVGLNQEQSTELALSIFNEILTPLFEDLPEPDETNIVTFDSESVGEKSQKEHTVREQQSSGKSFISLSTGQPPRTTAAVVPPPPPSPTPQQSTEQSSTPAPEASLPQTSTPSAGEEEQQEQKPSFFSHNTSQKQQVKSESVHIVDTPSSTDPYREPVE